MKANEQEALMSDNDAVEIFEENTVISLFDELDKEIHFYEIASIEHNEKFYELLQPVDKLEGIGEDEAVIFEYVFEEGDTQKVFKPIYDEELLNEVFSVYLRGIADYDFDEESCDCGCEDCDCDDECDHGENCGCEGDCECTHEHVHSEECKHSESKETINKDKKFTTKK